MCAAFIAKMERGRIGPARRLARKWRSATGRSTSRRFLRTLNRIGYTGPLTIEREIPQEPARQKAEIGRALRLLEDLKRKIG